MRQIKRCVPKNMTMFTLRKEPCAFKITLCDYGQNGNSQRGIAFWQYPFDCLIASAVCATQAPTPDPLRTAFAPLTSPASSLAGHSRYKTLCRGRWSPDRCNGMTDSSIKNSSCHHPFQQPLLGCLVLGEHTRLTDLQLTERGAEDTIGAIVADESRLLDKERGRVINGLVGGKHVRCLLF